MKLYEMWNDDNGIDFDQFRSIRQLLGTEDFNAPDLDFTEMQGMLAFADGAKT